MKFQTRFAGTLLAVAMLFASSPALAAGPQDAAGDALIELLSVKGIISKEEGAKLREKSAASTGSGFEGIVELLLGKGTISKDEAEALLKKLAVTPQTDKTEPVAVAKKDEVLAVAEDVRLPEKEIRPVIDVLREQGVLGSEEVEQIKERYGKKWSPSEEDDFIAVEGQEIEYNRSTLPKEGTLANIVKLQHQGLISSDESERIRERFLHKLSLERVTDAIGENVQRDMRAEIAAKIMPIPEWTQRIKLKGDLRLRYRADLFDKSNGLLWRPDTNTLTAANSTVDRYYTQVRARLGLTAKINDQLEAGITMATGNTTNPVSTNTTLGDTLNKKSFQLDQAYMKWLPDREVTILGGRFENPWFGTDLVWDPDVNFDGIAASWKPDLGGGLSMFMTAGAFPIEELEASNHDKWLYAGQVGVNYKYQDNLTATLAAAYYHFDNITGKLLTQNESIAKQINGFGATDWTRPKFQQKGNTVFYLDPFDNPRTTNNTSKSYLGYAAEFHELNISTQIDYILDDGNHVTLTGDYVNNLGYNTADVNARVGTAMKTETQGFMVGLSVGKPETRIAGDWRVLLNYKYLEADAVLDGFTESDFHLGGTNAKGWILGADLGLARNVWLNTRWFSADNISRDPLAIDVFQLNLNAKF